MILYSGPLSLFSRKVEIALAEKGLAFERVMVPFTQTRGYAPKNADVLAANPKGQVPVLKHGDLTLYDSTVILEYLEDAFPAPPLYPAGASERAHVRLMELEADEVLLTPVKTLMFRTEPPGDEPGRRAAQEDKAAAVVPEIDRHFAILDARLADADFLCGAFSVADIAMFMTVHYAARLGGPSIAPHAKLKRWYLHLAKRPAFATVVAEIAEADRALSYPVHKAFQGL